MDKLSIEESLSLLKKNSGSPLRSPLRISKKKSDESEDILDILREEDDPVTPPPPKDSSEEEEDSSEEERDSSEEERGGEEDSSEEEENSSEEEDLEISSGKILPVTPQRFTIKTPRTPTQKIKSMKKKKPEENSISSLRKNRYSILRFIYIGDKVNYIVCYDPYGQIVFVSTEDITSLKENVEDIDRIKLKESTKTEEMDDGYINGIKENVDFSLFGIVFYNGENYHFCERSKKGFFTDKFYRVKGEVDKKTISLPQTFIIVKLKDIMQDPEEVIETTKENYILIQNQQVNSSEYTFNEIVSSVKKLNKSLINFDKVYKSHSKGIIKDWKNLSVYAKDFYKKYYSEDGLEKSEKEKYDLVSVNMFLRFQFLNQNIEMIDKLYDIKEYLDQTADVLDGASEELEVKNDLCLSKVVKKSDMGKYI